MKETTIATVKRKKEGKELFLGSVDAGLKLLTDLRSTYHLVKGRKNGSASNVFEINFPDIKAGIPGKEVLHFTKPRVFIDRFGLDEQDNLHLNLRELSTQIHSEARDGSLSGSADFSGGGDLVIRPPLSQALVRVFECSATLIPSELTQFQNTLKRLCFNPATGETDYINKLPQLIQLTLKGFQGRSEIAHLTSRNTPELLVAIFNPLINHVRREIEKGKARNSAAEADYWQTVIAIRSMNIPRLQEDIAQLNTELALSSEQSSEQSSVHRMLSEYLTKAQYELKTAVDELSHAQSQAPLTQAVHKRLAMKLAKKERGGATTFSNMLAMATQLRQLMTTGKPQTLSLQRQQIDLDEYHRLHLSDIHCQLGGFSVTEDGVLSISVPALSAHSLFENLEINEELQTGFSVSDISLTFDPPLSGMLQSLLTMDYPLSSTELANVYQRFQALKTESVVLDDSARELSTNFKLSRPLVYGAFQLKSVPLVYDHK